MRPRICALIAVVVAALAAGCVPHFRVYRPFRDVNTILIDSRATNMMVSSAKAVLVAYRRTVESAAGTTEPKSPKLIIVNYDDLRNVRFVNEGIRTWNFTAGAVHSRETVLVYRDGYEPAWLERRYFGKQYRYPTTLKLKQCDPVRGRKMAFDAVDRAFRGEPESHRRAVLKKVAEEIK
jgi:hypothetical protein